MILASLKQQEAVRFSDLFRDPLLRKCLLVSSAGPAASQRPSDWHTRRRRLHNRKGPRPSADHLLIPLRCSPTIHRVGGGARLGAVLYYCSS